MKKKINKIIYFFGGLLVEQMKKKKSEKKMVQGVGMGYCPISSLGHDTMGLYHDTAGMGAQPGATIRPAVGHDTAGSGPRYGRLWATTRPARGHDTAS